MNGQRGANFTLIPAVSTGSNLLLTASKVEQHKKDSMDGCMPPLQKLAINRPSS